MNDTTTDKKEGGKVLRGVVMKTAMQDTVVVRVERYVQHPKYGKFIRKAEKYLVHDPDGKAQVGETVDIRETRPISKRKHFVLVGSRA